MDDRLADHRAAPHDEVEHAGRQARAAEDVRQRPAAARHQIGRLEHHAVAVGERGRDLPGGNRDREIPGGDQADHADRLARHLHAHARAYRGNDLARGAQRLAREKLEDLPGARGLAGRLRQRLALLAREQLAQLRAAREDLAAGEIERVETLLRRGDGPGRECRARRRDRGVHRGGIA